MSHLLWDIDALPGPQRHNGDLRYFVKHNGVVTESGHVIEGDRAIVIDMATGGNATRELLVALLGPGQLKTGLSLHRARVLARIANHPADYRDDIIAYRAKAARRGAA